MLNDLSFFFFPIVVCIYVVDNSFLIIITMFFVRFRAAWSNNRPANFLSIDLIYHMYAAVTQFFIKLPSMK